MSGAYPFARAGERDLQTAPRQQAYTAAALVCRTRVLPVSPLSVHTHMWSCRSQPTEVIDGASYQPAFREVRPAVCLRNEVRSSVRSGGDIPPGRAELLVGKHIGISVLFSEIVPGTIATQVAAT
jgi:hypothetical protein